MPARPFVQGLVCRLGRFLKKRWAVDSFRARESIRCILQATKNSVCHGHRELLRQLGAHGSDHGRGARHHLFF